MSEEEKTFEIQDEVVETKESTISVEEAENLDLHPEEVKSAKELGIVKAEGDKNDESNQDDSKEVEKETKEEKKETKEQDIETDLLKDEEDDPNKEHERYSKFSKNEKALYWKQKKEKKKRQDAESERDLAKVQLSAKDKEIALLKAKLAKKDVDKLDEDLDDDLYGKEDDEDKPLTKADLEKIEEEKSAKIETAKKNQARINADRKDAIVKYGEEHFEAVMDLAKEVMAEDEDLAKIFTLAITNPDKNLAEVAYKIAKNHPKYSEDYGKSDAPKKDTEKDDKKIDKMVKNSKKRTSSAGISGAGTKRVVSESDLKLEDAGKMSIEQWNKLSPQTRERLLMESCK